MPKTISQLNVTGIRMLAESITNEGLIYDAINANGLKDDDVENFSLVTVQDQNGHLYAIVSKLIQKEGEAVWTGSNLACEYVPIDITEKIDKLEFVEDGKLEESIDEENDEDEDDEDGKIMFAETHVVTYGIDLHGKLHVLAHYADTKLDSSDDNTRYVAENANDLMSSGLGIRVTGFLTMAAAKDGIDASTDKELTNKIRKVFAK